jgi:hypothetical protein
VSAFGAGYFDDAADVPGQPVLHFGLRGKFRDGEVELVKVCVVLYLIVYDIAYSYRHAAEAWWRGKRTSVYTILYMI